MIIPKKMTALLRKGRVHWALSMATAMGLLLITASAFADDPVTMAPPIGNASAAQPLDGAPGNASADSVFNWTEIPQNEQVPIRRATFDQGGYQLYDTVGETIVVPFTNENLYVMKFGQSKNGKMYFINTGDYPLLYVPKNGYLENATVSGARWYPFSQDFHPEQPVFLGIAPSWPTFIDMGWYPGMSYWGGYWCNTSFIAGGIFLPTIGLFFEIGGHPYYGWPAYRSYCFYHPAPYRITYYRPDFYRWANRPYWEHRPFVGAGGTHWADRSLGGDRYFGRDRYFGGDISHNNRLTEPTGRRFLGADSHSVYAHRSFSDDRALRGTEHTFVGAQPSFGGGQAFTGSRTLDEGHAVLGGSGRTFEGVHPSFNSGARTFGGNQRVFNSDRGFSGGRTFESARPAFSGRSFSNGPSSGGGRSFGGGSFGDGRSFGGGGRR
jgi:hypothetical protein